MKVLMVMPFDDSFGDVHAACERAIAKAKEIARDTADHPRSGWIESLELYRVDEGHGAVDIMDDLLKHMREATLCIADISGNNPNVLWELGYAMALEKPVIILSQDIETAPFDVSSYRMLTYSRDQLEDSLVIPLADQISGVFRDLPEVTAFPEEFAFARTLAMSVATPAYFLDPDFNVQYMNEAAVALFLADSGQSAGQWVGKSLVAFINEFADRLINLTEIERNLQLQKEKLWRRQVSGTAHPLNVERIVLDTVRYGIVEMQKTGIAVRNVNDNRIAGWVVSFNFISATPPELFKSFFDNHKAVLENQILCNSRVLTNPQNGTERNDETPKWSNVDTANATFEWAGNYSAKQDSFEFMAKIMTCDQERYGLASVSYLSDFFFEYKRTEFLRLLIDGRLIGLLRLHIGHDLGNYSSLEADVVNAVQDGQGFADAGVYFPSDTPSEIRLKLLGELLGRAVDRAEGANVTNLYAQIPVRLVERYREFGFSQAGPSFFCDGWSGKWVPIWVQNWNFQFATTDMAGLFKTAFEGGRERSQKSLLV